MSTDQQRPDEELRNSDNDDEDDPLAVEDEDHPLYSPVFAQIRKLAGSMPSIAEVQKAEADARSTPEAPKSALGKWARATAKARTK